MMNILKKDDKDDKEQESVGSEDQKSVDSDSGKIKEITSPSSNCEIKRRNVSLVNRNNIKKYKLRSSYKIHKKKISLIKMLNKPFCFMSSKSKKDNNNFLSDEVRKLNIHKNILNSNDKN